MGENIEIDAKPTTGEIVRARLHLYFGSRYVRLMLFASLGYTGLSWWMAGGFKALFAYPMLFAWIILPMAVALGGIRSKEIRDFTTYGIHYRFSSTGVSWQLATDIGQASGSHEWTVIRRWKETNDLLLLFAGLTVIVLPKHAFASTDAIDSLRVLLRFHIAKS
jgi:hypothetical protein